MQTANQRARLQQQGRARRSSNEDASKMSGEVAKHSEVADAAIAMGIRIKFSGHSMADDVAEPECQH